MMDKSEFERLLADVDIPTTEETITNPCSMSHMAAQEEMNSLIARNPKLVENTELFQWLEQFYVWYDSHAAEDKKPAQWIRINTMPGSVMFDMAEAVLKYTTISIAARKGLSEQEKIINIKAVSDILMCMLDAVTMAAMMGYFAGTQGRKVSDE